MSQSERDVRDAMEYFKAHRRIPQAVMEASIFRQPYFVGKFLPALLTPAAGQHERQELIEALDRLVWGVTVTVRGVRAVRLTCRERKIPPRMLRNYEKGCDELRKKGISPSLQPI